MKPSLAENHRKFLSWLNAGILAGPEVERLVATARKIEPTRPLASISGNEPLVTRFWSSQRIPSRSERAC
jgi:hypothetical protein